MIFKQIAFTAQFWIIPSPSAFFQKFLKDSGILEQLEEAGIQEGDTVRMYGLQFDYYK